MSNTVSSSFSMKEHRLQMMRSSSSFAAPLQVKQLTKVAAAHQPSARIWALAMKPVPVHLWSLKVIVSPTALTKSWSTQSSKENLVGQGNFLAKIQSTLNLTSQHSKPLKLPTKHSENKSTVVSWERASYRRQGRTKTTKSSSKARWRKPRSPYWSSSSSTTFAACLDRNRLSQITLPT